MTPFSLREYLAISENPALLNDALKYHRMTQKSKESEDFRAFLSVLSESLDKAKDIDGWFLGTDLGVVPDFDVLWYGQKFVLNINLKHVWLSTMSKKTVRTFKTQARIFRLLSPDLLVCNIVFDAHEKTFFKLENDSLIEISVNYLLKLMNGKNGLQQNQVANLSSSSFLISPLTDTEGFLSDKYWLAEDQESIKQGCSQPGVFGVQGKAGSGKSLIAFDLAKSLNGKKNVLFVFSGAIRPAHKYLETIFASVHFVPAKSVGKEDLDKYDVLIVDEAQRLYDEQRKQIAQWAEENYSKKTVLFFYDVDQALGPKDAGNLMHSLCTSFERRKKGKVFFLKKGFDPIQVFKHL